MVATARCGCAAGGCSCVVIGDPVSAGCIDTVVTGTGSLTDPFIISSSVIIDPNACNLTDCGEAGLITLLNTMDSFCIEFLGCGTVASPLTASPIFDPDTEDCINCGPNGFLIVVDPVTGNQLSCGPNGLLVAPAASGGGISAVAVDTSCIDMTVTGDGTLGSPLTISAIPVVDPVTGNQLSCGPNGLLVAPAVSGTGSSGQTLKRVVLSGDGEKSTTSLTRTPVDAASLPYQTFMMAVGDLVELEFAAAAEQATLGEALRFDYEVDQPTSANLYVGAANTCGVAEYIANRASSCIPILWKAVFVATEAGVHGFRPVFFVSGSTGTIRNPASGSGDGFITFIVKHWPAASVL